MPESKADTPEVKVHRHIASALPVNAYLVETRRGVVAVDTTLTVPCRPS